VKLGKIDVMNASLARSASRPKGESLLRGSLLVSDFGEFAFVFCAVWISKNLDRLLNLKFDF
ncbi:hypothetical protein MLD52_11645, partial [Puniceicoccaceae bacterium K14]|nr:hypothetical protein [Puniceicoccaceae bacterium K14]